MAKFDWEKNRLKQLEKRNGFEYIENSSTETYYQQLAYKEYYQEDEEFEKEVEGKICKFCEKWFYFADLVKHYGECKKASWGNKDSVIENPKNTEAKNIDDETLTKIIANRPALIQGIWKRVETGDLFKIIQNDLKIKMIFFKPSYNAMNHGYKQGDTKLTGILQKDTLKGQIEIRFSKTKQRLPRKVLWVDTILNLSNDEKFLKGFYELKIFDCNESKIIDLGKTIITLTKMK